MTESTHGKIPHYEIHPVPAFRERVSELLETAEADTRRFISPTGTLANPEYDLYLSFIFNELGVDLVEAFEEIHNDFSRSSR